MRSISSIGRETCAASSSGTLCIARNSSLGSRLLARSKSMPTISSCTVWQRSVLLAVSRGWSIEPHGGIVCLGHRGRRRDCFGFQCPDCVIDRTRGQVQDRREHALARSSTLALQEGHNAKWIEAVGVVCLAAGYKAPERTEPPPLRIVADLGSVTAP